MNINELRAKAEEAKRLMLTHANKFAPKWESLFSFCHSGDFREETDGGDWIYTEDEDFEGGWRKDSYAINYERKEGIESVEITTVDSDGNWDCIETFTKEDEVNRCYQRTFACLHCYYELLQNKLYSLYVIETGEDPLKTTWCKNDPVEVHARDLEEEITDLCESVQKTISKN
jgi:hypothetical protein